jgi:hypothetical protein
MIPMYLLHRGQLRATYLAISSPEDCLEASLVLVLSSVADRR